MSTNSDSSQPSETNQRKRSASPSGESESTLLKQAKVSDEERRNDSNEDAEPEKVGNGEPKHGSEHLEDAKEKDVVIRDEADAQESTGGGESARQPSDSAAIAAAEALASLTGGDGDEDCKEMPCSSNKASREKSRYKSSRPGCSQSERRTEAAAADSSSSLLLCEDREDPEQASFVDDDDEEEEEDDSLAGSSSTASSSVASDNEDNEDGECAIVSVKMAPEVRQSVALLAQVQMRLDALEKKGARLHQRLEMKLSRQRRPHLDQRSAITQAIPGFWVTAIESFKNNKLGYRICFHFRRNPFFQNKMIVKELHLGMGGSPVSFSNPILWHRGQNLVGSGEPRRTSQGVYQSFFHWFSDHSNPGRDEIAQKPFEVLPDSTLGATRERQGSNNGDDCVIISDSDEDEEQKSQNLEQEDEDDDQVGGSEDNDRDEGESSYEEREEEEVDVEEVEDSRDSGGCEVREQGQEEEDIDVDEEKS
ncbi:Testis-specific Y-encoded-like protein 1 [Labeo rohita]|uniref:Testis-specific Y-encoded-like protein 1 n=1 Tax=Labeo rohita TaxID=84645 RepID=A0ABQ8MFJ6_LABRO|nr:Testis-specific Y-encoded-like protein 1 [Labeo rohita]